MKWYAYIGIAAVLLIVLFVVQSVGSNDVVESPLPTANVLATQEATLQESEQSAVQRYDLYIIGNEAIPVTYEAEAGDTVVLTLVDSADYDEIDFQVPELSIVERLDVGSEVEFVVPEAGNFDFFCMTCRPALQGNILVHE